MADTSVEQIDALLPQIHCGQCGYDGCRPYAEALKSGTADINQCPPGGETTRDALAGLLDRPARPIDPERGHAIPPQIARIDESACIGCVKCLRVCPVDAIIGAAKQMHTVIAEDCTGCELCQPACPVDCISMEPAGAMTAGERARARSHFQRRQQRLQRQAAARQQRRAAASRADKQRAIAAAVARNRARRGQSGHQPG
ncbi:electron transport complex protein RnfB [Methylohalomonas lacus]|uniref:Electron transport complex protein RnfB n=1 Tax=Methylohalomonas lacus TaxID=398773 RepID=A0AAE3HP69_9GAMM|nr:RnfABCDGE type electron transport complex subunit B [Methylohalomonas lacus]MCS3904288.1 electron transport complex protein RnfB [Methylohalomonas lacus]